MIVGVHHVGLCVPELDQALQFYCGVLGMEDLWGYSIDGADHMSDSVIGLQNVKARMRMIRAGANYIELWEYIHPTPKPLEPAYPPSNRGFTHIALQVTDIDEEYERLVKSGMSFVGPPVRLGPAAAVYGRDPYGNIVELYEIYDPAIPQLTMPPRRTSG